MTSVFDAGVCIFPSRHPAKLSALREVTEFVSEFVGTALFAFFGGLAGASGVGAAGGNGIALAVLVYCTASVSGGKLNPGVSLALFLINTWPLRITVPKLLIEWTAQISGAIAGAALVKALAYNMPGAGCFLPPAGIPQASVFGLETLATFLLVSVILAVAVDNTGSMEAGRTRFGIVAPLAIGMSLWAAAQAVGPLTGGALNTARLIGPAVVGACGTGAWKYAGSYIGGHALGAVAAAFMHALRTMVHDHFSGCDARDRSAVQKRGKEHHRLAAPRMGDDA